MPKKKASYFKNNKGGAIQTPPKGSRGILVTCDIGFSQKAVDQVLDLLNSYADPLPEEENNEEAEPEKELTLEEELQQLKNPKSAQKQKKQNSRFITYKSEVSGNIFIRFAKEQDDPFVFLEKYFAHLKETGQSLTTKVIRMYPIQSSGFPSTEESLPVLDSLIKSYFHPDTAINYEIVIQRKHKGNSQPETHDELNQKIVNLVGPPHRPSYHEGDVGILWLSLGRNLYMGVVPKWREWCNCNVPKYAARAILQTTPETDK